MRAVLGLDSLATIEFTLWEGQAHDALESLRIAIKTFNYNFQFKTDQSRPIKPSVNLTESVRPLNTSTKLTPQRYHPAKLTTLTTRWLQNSGGAQWLPVGCLVTWIWLESPVRVSGTTTMMGDRGGGRKNKENVRKFSMLRIQHDHVMSEFQRT